MKFKTRKIMKIHLTGLHKFPFLTYSFAWPCRATMRLKTPWLFQTQLNWNIPEALAATISKFSAFSIYPSIPMISVLPQGRTYWRWRRARLYLSRSSGKRSTSSSGKGWPSSWTPWPGTSRTPSSHATGAPSHPPQKPQSKFALRRQGTTQSSGVVNNSFFSIQQCSSYFLSRC